MPDDLQTKSQQDQKNRTVDQSRFTNKLQEVTDPSKIKAGAALTTSPDVAEFYNSCGVMIYVHIEWPHGGHTNFTLGPGETHSLYIGTGGNPCGCFSTKGVISDCSHLCRVIEGGKSYRSC